MSGASGEAKNDEKQQVTFTNMDKVFVVSGLIAARTIERHLGEVQPLAVLLSATTGACVLGLMDTKSSPAVKTMTVAAITGAAFIGLSNFEYSTNRLGCDGAVLIAAGVVAAATYHFLSSYLTDVDHFGWNNMGLPLNDPKYAYPKAEKKL